MNKSSNSPLLIPCDDLNTKSPSINPKSNADYYKNYLHSYDYYNVANNPIYYSIKGERPAPSINQSSAFEELDALIKSNKYHKIETKQQQQQQKTKQNNLTATVLMKKSEQSSRQDTIKSNSLTKFDSIPEIKLKNTHKSIENLLYDEETLIKPCQVNNKLINKNLNEFKTSLYIGPEFGPDDISVQLIDNKKLIVHCLKIEPLKSNSLTINTSKIAGPTTIDLDLTKGNNSLKRELKKDVFLPENCDINTLESYLENCNLFIKCLCYDTPVYTSVKYSALKNNIFQNPLYSDLDRSIRSRDKKKCRSLKRPKSTEGFLNEHKSVRFEVGAERSKSRSIERHLTASQRLINDDMLEDGFNCITRDPMQNIFLTYFFKLPNCSPSDRTQVRIENKNILKLKIIQETNLSKRNDFSSSLESSSLESIDTDSMTESNEDDDDEDKLMLREFSRHCRLPDNFFKFDESGVSVSFVSNGWVRVEIPIMEFFDFNCALTNSKLNKVNHKKKIDKHRDQYQLKNEIYSNEVRI
ncbi:unnamed protein product [Brachionus calyciflorus]|uniref:Uncharacterized protein n=1 Tax=Brachionus calyciflorus TaxID=104777 RepID=A0A814CVP1_9BILA|nr:unnamed protein product [Brachionus calyciflorus]